MPEKPLSDEDLARLVEMQPELRDAAELLKEARNAGELPGTEHTAGAIRSGTITDINTLLDRLCELPPCKYIDPAPEEFNPREGRLADMNTAVITDAGSPCPMTGTTGLSTCMGVTIFNPVTRAGGVIHITESEDVFHMSDASRNALNALLAAIRTDPQQTLEVRIQGPMGNARAFAGEVVQVLNDQPNLLFLSADFLGKNFANTFALDTRRWEDGLIKGSATMYRSRMEAEGGEAMVADARNVVETVDAMPVGRPGDQGLCDMRGVTPPPPAALTDDVLDALVAKDPTMEAAIKAIKAARAKGDLQDL